MSTILKIGLLLTIAAAPVALQERAKLCAQPRSIDATFSIAVRRDVGMHWLDRNQCSFQRVFAPDAGVSLVEWGRVTEPVRGKAGWILGECITHRRVQREHSMVESSFRCTPPQLKVREVETRFDGTTTTSVFNSDSGVLEHRFTDRVLFDREHALRCEWFAPDGGVAEVIEYGVRTRDGCVPLGAPAQPMPASRVQYYRL